ncbi:MAG: hypothetical protein AVDCRST_MAG25-2714 [uncultured Rubrobacteraceae bacterium]|uniref:Uncharacterized protein n=1 Tax=uncultured Rubrobacteraceae bacterium TaxID=349277 RepID=A0A6J4S0A9_9ACTN|nr:MAG: hypothetical protein AVDCRST_MAG25-2714 [uncultured Rubrobacteraceae bacterium]
MEALGYARFWRAGATDHVRLESPVVTFDDTGGSAHAA